MGFREQFNRLVQWAHRRHGPRDLADTVRGLRGCESSPLVQALAEDQQQHLDQMLLGLFGYHLLELSCFQIPELCSNSRINHRFRLSPAEGSDAQALASFEELPLASESLDVVVLHHALDFSPRPHQVLREANRTLIPRGHLIIVGFNPWSLQGAYKLLAQWLGAGDFWRRRSLRAGRIMDWLRLLDCEPVHIERGFYRLPVNHEGMLEKFTFWERACRFLKLPFGGYYMILARKDRMAVRPIKPLWKGINPMAGLVLGKPAGRMPEPVRPKIKHH